MTALSDLARRLGVAQWQVQLACRRLRVETGITRALEPGIADEDIERVTEEIRGGR